MNDPEPSTPDRKHRRWPWVGGIVAVLLSMIVRGFVWWAASTPDTEAAALAALESDDLVRVTETNGYTFAPQPDTRVGFILYPGGRVDPASYAVPARRNSRSRLPADTEYVAIAGGNHAQFGDYGPQAGDNPATISRAEQQARAVEATLWVLRAAA